MKDFFKPDDFYSQGIIQRYLGAPVGGKTIFCSEAAQVANEKLNALIESWPVVYGNKYISNDGASLDIGSVWNITKLADKKYLARLAFMEELPKEPCKHEPQLRFDGTRDKEPPYYYEPMGIWCKHCGVELQATWTEVKS